MEEGELLLGPPDVAVKHRTQLLSTWTQPYAPTLLSTWTQPSVPTLSLTLLSYQHGLSPLLRPFANAIVNMDSALCSNDCSFQGTER